METISFKLDAFEGPLDLLLYLITKHKLNICDIEISLLLDQYLEYIESIDEQDFDAAGDFLAIFLPFEKLPSDLHQDGKGRLPPDCHLRKRAIMTRHISNAIADPYFSFS